MGNIIVFEGVDGCGKSTLSKELAISLKQIGYKVSWHREPGGTVLGESLRDMVLNPVNHISSVTETLMLYAGRQQLLELARSNPDTLFILDRHYVSTHVYQGQDPVALQLSKDLAASLLNPDDYILTVLVERDNPELGKGVVPDALERKYSTNPEQNINAYRRYVLEDSMDKGLLFVNKTNALDAAHSNLLELFRWKYKDALDKFKV